MMKPIEFLKIAAAGLFNAHQVAHHRKKRSDVDRIASHVASDSDDYAAAMYLHHKEAVGYREEQRQAA